MSDAPEKTVTLTLRLSQAEEISAGLSDLLCWCRGFVAACPDELQRHPLNWEVARDIRMPLDRAIRQTKEPF